MEDQGNDVRDVVVMLRRVSCPEKQPRAANKEADGAAGTAAGTNRKR